MNEFSGISLNLQGHLRILEYADRDSYTRRVPTRTLLNRRNAIHKDHAAILVANALAHRPNCNITYMVFGNGGTTLNNTGTISFHNPNIMGLTPDLYNSTFFHMVDDVGGALPGNQMGVRHISNSLFADMDIRCLITQNEPFGQLASNTISDITTATTWGPFHSQFSFDEIGLKLADGTLITHVIFTPVVKTASSILEVIYTIRLAIADVFTPTLSPTRNLIGQQATTQIGQITFPSSFTARAIKLDGTTSFWDFPALSNSSTGTMSVWVYLPRNFGFHPYPVDDYLSYFATSYLLAAPNENELFLGNGWAGDIRFTIASVSNAVQAVITVNAKLSELLNIPAKVIVKGFGQGGGWAASATQELNVISNTDTTITVNWDTSGYTVYNPALNTNTAINLSYISNITSTNPAVITTSVPHGINASVDEVWIATAGLQQATWNTWIAGGPPPVQVLSSTSTTITVNASAIGFPVYDPKQNSGLRIEILNAFNFYANSAISNANFISWQSSKPMPNEQWVNLLLSWDTGQVAGSKKVSFYYGDTVVPMSVFKDFDPSFTIPYSDGIPATNSTTGWKVSGNGGANHNGCIGYMAEFWFAPGVFMDFSNSSNRAKFHDIGTGKAISLGATGSTPTGSAPSIYLSLNNSVQTTPDPVLNWVDPNGNTLTQFPGTLGGVADSTQMVLSFWVDRNTRMDDLMDGWGVIIHANRDSKPSTIFVQLFDASSNRFFFNFPYDAGTGKNIRIAVDTNHTIGTKIVHAYVGTSTATVTVTADDVNNLVVKWVDAGSNFDILNFVNGYIAEVWFGPGQYFDPVNKFVDGGGNPVSLGVDGSLPSGTAPAVYLHRANGDPASIFNTNRGTGGNFTGANNFILENGTRFSDNLAGTGRMISSWGTAEFAPTSPTD